MFEFNANTGAYVGSFTAPSPLVLTFGQDGDLYISGRDDANVSRYDPKTGAVSTFVQAGSGGLVLAAGLAFGPDGNLYVNNTSITGATTDHILEYSGQTGAFIKDFADPNTNGLTALAAIVLGPDNNFYVSGNTTMNVLEYNYNTGFVRTFVASDTGGLNSPVLGLAFTVPESNMLSGGILALGLGALMKRKLEQKK